jgi:hypothetical protein
MSHLGKIDLGPIIPTLLRPSDWPMNKPVYLIQDQAGHRYVVKVFPTGFLPSVTRRTAYERELATYRSVPSIIGDKVRIPKLIAWGPSHLVLEYLEPLQPVYDFLLARGSDDFIDALAAFHWDTPATPLPTHLELSHRATYSPEWDARRNALGVVRRRFGTAVAARCLRILSWCRGQQPRLRRMFNAHNDLMASNVSPGADGRYQFIDFASRTTEARWVLDDIVRFGFLMRDMERARALVELYAKRLGDRGVGAVDVRSQIRFSLLRLSMSMLKWSPEFRVAGSRLIVEVLIGEHRFDSWLSSWESPFVPE